MSEEKNLSESLNGQETNNKAENVQPANSNASPMANNDSISQPPTINEQPSPERETQNQKPETASKHPYPAHQKKWTEYLLDFLMIFVAVFLGFIAESYREKQGNT